MLEEILEDMDEYLRGCELRKKDWEIVRKDETGLLTSFGTIRYSRTYFKPKKGGKRQHLVDKIVGIEPHDRVSADVVINAIDEAADSSYRKAGETAAYMDVIPKTDVQLTVIDFYFSLFQTLSPTIRKLPEEPFCKLSKLRRGKLTLGLHFCSAPFILSVNMREERVE